MWTVIGQLLVGILIPIVKMIFEAINKKKLDDKEFVAYILAHQRKRARAGKSAVDANDALDEAMRDIEKTEEEVKKAQM